MKQMFRLAALALVVLSVSACKTNSPKATPAFVPPPESWTFAFADGRTWDIAEQTRTNEAVTVIYVLPGQTKDKWAELVTTGLTLNGQRKSTVSALAEVTHKALEKDCQGLKWEILEEAEKNVVYEWQHYGCKDKKPAQHEIARLSVGRIGIHRLAYDSRTGLIPPGLRRAWIKAISEATLGPTSR